MKKKQEKQEKDLGVIFSDNQKTIDHWAAASKKSKQDVRLHYKKN